jgi:glycosyltransferase involved in cell wall biosynthesis
MKLGLCMVVRNEAHQIVPCLGSIIDLFDQVAIVDTGSLDGTPERLKRDLGVTPLHASLAWNRCDCLCDARAEALGYLSTPWVMLLDADERVDRSTLARICAKPDGDDDAGYFGKWINHVDGTAPFEDYKLFLFRKGLQTRGLVHDVVQHEIRVRGFRASWLPELTVQHFPDPIRRRAKAASYRERLRCAIAQEPQFLRYHWFLGYMEFLDERYDAAIDCLGRSARSQSREFPVESLNSSMVLADIHARRGDRREVGRTLDAAITFLASVADDFEVAINTRLGPWLAAAHESLRTGRLEAIRAYRFAC